MGMSYTQNLHLGMQEDKRDYLNWDAITQNWKTLDNISGSGSGKLTKARVKLNNPMTSGKFETFDIPSALASEQSDIKSGANLGDEIGAGLVSGSVIKNEKEDN